MNGITRRGTLAATLVAAAASATEVRATPTQVSVPAWSAFIQNTNYSTSALIFERPEGMLIVESASDLFHRGERDELGSAYFAPDHMNVELESKVEVPASLLAAALALHTAQENMLQMNDVIEQALS